MAQRPVFVYPFALPLFTWFSGHSSALRDTEGHKKSASLLSVCDFVRNIESVQIACEASALPLSQAGINLLESIVYSHNWTSEIRGNYAVNVAILNDLCSLAPAVVQTIGQTILFVEPELVKSRLYGAEVGPNPQED